MCKKMLALPTVKSRLKYLRLRYLRLWGVSLCAPVILAACTTVHTGPIPHEPIKNAPIPTPIAQPEPEGPPPVLTPTPDPVLVTPPTQPPVPDVIKSAFSSLPHWGGGDLSPALKSFKKSCQVWAKRDDHKPLSSAHPEFGVYKDWQPACNVARDLAVNHENAHSFFQGFFEPVTLSNPDSEDGSGLLTGYYAPILEARRLPDAVFSEPILARPTDMAIQRQPRKNINALSAKVLAYGRPIDVFFLQVQGSGQIKFANGDMYRVAFDGHNYQKYTSIGKVLVARGDLPAHAASKQAIEQWMARVGPKRTRDLINENARYIFFKTEYLSADEGPRGSMHVPLTAMGSMAVDPKIYPYGALFWVVTKLPQAAGDYNGVETGVLLSAQDSGGAIKGPMRGDLFFGTGDDAGALAGVQKHRARWYALLPVQLAWALNGTILPVS